MELLSVVLLVVDLVCTLVFTFSLYHVLRYALCRVADWRGDAGKWPWPKRLCTILALMSAISFFV